jgi:hypothetical protein
VEIEHGRRHRGGREGHAVRRVRGLRDVGAGLLDPVDPRGLVDPRDDPKVGPHRPGGEHDHQVLGVGVARGDQGAGAVDAGSLQVFLVGRVADHLDAAHGADERFGGWVPVDHDARLADLEETSDDGLADAAEPDRDHMVRQPVSHALGLSSADLGEGVTRDEEVREDRDGVDEGREPDDDDRDRQDATGRVEGMDLPVADGAERDDRHVDGVDPAKSLDPDVPNRGERGEGQYCEQRPPQSIQHEGEHARVVGRFVVEPVPSPPAHDVSLAHPAHRSEPRVAPGGSTRGLLPSRGEKSSSALIGALPAVVVWC